MLILLDVVVGFRLSCGNSTILFRVTQNHQPHRPVNGISCIHIFSIVSVMLRFYKSASNPRDLWESYFVFLSIFASHFPYFYAKITFENLYFHPTNSIEPFILHIHFFMSNHCILAIATKFRKNSCQ